MPTDHPEAEPYILDPESLGDSRSWLAQNRGYQYNLLGAAAADEFVLDKFRHNHAIIDTYQDLRNPGMKTDFLRYLVLFAEGGVYSDLDTWAFQPIDRWVPRELRGRVQAIVDPEFDQLDGGPWPGFGDEPSHMTRGPVLSVDHRRGTGASYPGQHGTASHGQYRKLGHPPRQSRSGTQRHGVRGRHQHRPGGVDRRSV